MRLLPRPPCGPARPALAPAGGGVPAEVGVHEQCRSTGAAAAAAAGDAGMQRRVRPWQRRGGGGRRMAAAAATDDTNAMVKGSRGWGRGGFDDRWASEQASEWVLGGGVDEGSGGVGARAMAGRKWDVEAWTQRLSVLGGDAGPLPRISRCAAKRPPPPHLPAGADRSAAGVAGVGLHGD